jgi:hypothetical protein
MTIDLLLVVYSQGNSDFGSGPKFGRSQQKGSTQKSPLKNRGPNHPWSPPEKPSVGRRLK